MDDGSATPIAIPRDGPGGPRRGLSPRAERVARAAMEAMLADEDAAGRLLPGSPAACERAVSWLTLATGQASGDVRRGFGLLTFFLQWLPLLVIGAPRRMTSLSLADRLRYLEALETSRIGLLSMLLLAFKVPMSIAAFEEGPELRSTGFDRPDTTSRRSFALAVIPPGDERTAVGGTMSASASADIASGESIVIGRDLPRGFDVSCDVVVVGSGAGGAVAAALLAEAGHSVVVLEEGPYVRPDEYQTWTPSQSVRRLFREAGLLTAFGAGQTPMISLTVGRAVGGSSLLTGGVCFRIPGEVHHRWVRDLGLAELSERALEPAYEEVERRLRVREVPEWMRSRSTQKFVEGAGKMGVTMRPIRRNTGSDCEGNGRCNFACPAGAKRSVDVAYLPSATAHGARIVSDALVTRVLVENGRAAGVEGHLLGGDDARGSHAFRVRAPRVVAACGTIHTPLLLFRTGLGERSGELGRHITLHPASRVVARFDEVVNGWDGALQSVYSDDFSHEGIKLLGVYSAINVLAAGMPGVGPAFRRRVRALPHCGVFGGMVHDEGGGTVRPGLGREPLLWYEMAPRDLARLRRAITLLSEMAFAAGAREVFTSVLGAPPITNMDQARALERSSIDARRIECMAFHPLGSARVANDPRRGVVDQKGEAYELPGLFVMDGSVLPTSIGVNSQVPIMSLSASLSWRLAEHISAEKARASRHTRRPQAERAR